MKKIFENSGRAINQFLSETGALSLLLIRIIFCTPYIFKDRKRIIGQMRELGVNSLPIIIIIAAFSGSVTAWQAAYQFGDYIPDSFMGVAIYRSLILELGPVLTALVIAGRVGASIAAELGTMKVTEQIDALRAMAIDPIRYLALPRLVANTLMLPVLVIFTDLISVFFGFLVAHLFNGISGAVFFGQVQDFFLLWDIFGSLLKALVFGLVTSLVGCFVGFRAESGAAGVGRATIRAFVVSSVLILAFDFIIAALVF